MKKIFAALAVVLIAMLGLAVWLVWRSAGASDAPSLLPEQTVAFVSLPDISRSKVRWPNTALSLIGAEPEMSAFLEKPLKFIGKSGGMDEANAIIKKLDLHQVFVAAVSVSAKESSILIGFQYGGGKAAHDDAVKRLRHELAGGGPASEIMREPYQNTEITGSMHQGTTLYSATSGGWGFLSNSLPILKETLDRAAGRKVNGTVAQTERYKKTMAHLTKEPDLLVYVQPQPLLETLLAVGQAMGAQPVPQQLEQARKVEAFGAAVKFDGPNLRDSAFFLYPNPPEIGTLTHIASQFTDKDTIAYFDTVVDLQQLATAEKNPAFAALMASPALQATKLPELFPQAFGPEFAFTSSWSPNSMRPTGVAALQVKDPEKALESIQQILTLYPDTAVSDQGGVKLYSFPALKSPFSNPTMALKDKFLFIGVDSSDLQRALGNPTSDTMEQSPNFAPALPSFHKPGQVFGYIDTRAIFERGYPMLRQVIMFGAAFMPGASDIVDTSKLPQTDTIARHLTPILYSQNRLPDGFLMESSGPITLNQAAFLGVVGGAAFFKSGQH
ncbi:hypothetical protein BH09VER1_BH09VER1_24150 [soil metagenome]